MENLTLLAASETEAPLPEPSDELRAAFLEVTVALARCEAIVAPLVATATRAFALLAAEAVEDSTPDERPLAWWEEWHELAGEDAMSRALEDLCRHLAHFTPGSELPIIA